MSQAPIPRGPLGQLLDDAKVASEKDWRDVESESGIPLATIQAWTSGRTAEPPLRGVLHLAKHLGVKPQDVMDRALEGYVPPLRARAMNGAGAEPAQGSASSVDVDQVGQAVAGRKASPRPKPKPRRSSRQPES